MEFPVPVGKGAETEVEYGDLEEGENAEWGCEGGRDVRCIWVAGMIVILWSTRLHFVFCFVWYVICALFSSVAFQRVVSCILPGGLMIRWGFLTVDWTGIL